MKKIDVKSIAKKAIRFVLNPKLLFCVGLAWMITNGWSYVLFGIGSYYGIGWMVAVSGVYLAFLWLPISPEKLVTFAIAIALLRLLFPRDEKTLGVLVELYNAARSAVKSKRKKRDKPEDDSRDDNNLGNDC